MVSGTEWEINVVCLNFLVEFVPWNFSKILFCHICNIVCYFGENNVWASFDMLWIWVCNFDMLYIWVGNYVRNKVSFLYIEIFFLINLRIGWKYLHQWDRITMKPMEKKAGIATLNIYNNKPHFSHYMVVLWSDK